MQLIYSTKRADTEIQEKIALLIYKDRRIECPFTTNAYIHSAQNALRTSG